MATEENWKLNDILMKIRKESSRGTLMERSTENLVRKSKKIVMVLRRRLLDIENRGFYY